MQLPSVQELIETIYLCGLGQKPWLDFMVTFEKLLPNPGSNFVVTTGSGMTGSISLNTGFPQSEIERFNQHYYCINPWTPMVTSAELGIGMNTDTMLDRKVLQKTEYYNDFMRPLELEGAVGVVIARDEGKSFVFNTMTGSDSYETKQAAAGVLTSIAPHMRRAFDFMRNSISGESQLLLSSIGIGVVMVSDHFDLRYRNDIAMLMMEKGCGISIGPTRKCQFHDPALRDAATAAALSAPGLSTVTFSRLSARRGFRFTFVRMSAPAIVEYLEGPRIAILIEDRFSRSTEEALASLARRSGLTLAEADTARCVIETDSVVGAAKMRGVSAETIKSQIKSVYTKLDINSRGELLRLLI